MKEDAISPHALKDFCEKDTARLLNRLNGWHENEEPLEVMIIRSPKVAIQTSLEDFKKNYTNALGDLRGQIQEFRDSGFNVIALEVEVNFDTQFGLKHSGGLMIIAKVRRSKNYAAPVVSAAASEREVGT